RRARWHVYRYPIFGHQLLCCRHVLIAGSEDLIDLGNAVCAKSQRCNSLSSADLDDLGDADQVSSKQDRRMNLSFPVGGRTEDYFFAASKLSGNAEHQDRAEKRSGAARNIQSDPMDRDAFS